MKGYELCIEVLMRDIDRLDWIFSPSQLEAAASAVTEETLEDYLKQDTASKIRSLRAHCILNRKPCRDPLGLSYQYLKAQRVVDEILLPGSKPFNNFLQWCSLRGYTEWLSMDPVRTLSIPVVEKVFETTRHWMK